MTGVQTNRIPSNRVTESKNTDYSIVIGLHKRSLEYSFICRLIWARRFGCYVRHTHGIWNMIALVRLFALAYTPDRYDDDDENKGTYNMWFIELTTRENHRRPIESIANSCAKVINCNFGPTSVRLDHRLWCTGRAECTWTPPNVL